MDATGSASSGRILFPLIKPAVITSTIFSFYWRWDDFLGPLLFLNNPKQYTVSLALRMFSDPQTSTDWSAVFAMGTLSPCSGDLDLPGIPEIHRRRVGYNRNEELGRKNEVLS
jgi:ABC-type spermidine/putrescine transport system permease subunit II